MLNHHCKFSTYFTADSPPATLSTGPETVSIDDISTRITDSEPAEESEATKPESDSQLTDMVTESYTTAVSSDVESNVTDSSMATDGELAAGTDSTVVPGEESTLKPISSTETSTDSSISVEESTSPGSANGIDTVSTAAPSEEEADSTGVTAASELVTKQPIEGMDVSNAPETSSEKPEEIVTSSAGAEIEMTTESQQGVEEITTEASIDEIKPDESVSTVQGTTVGLDVQESSTSLPSEEAPPSTSTPDAVEVTTDESSTDSSLSTSECTIDGITYVDGEMMPVKNACQESCLCSNGTMQCDQVACPPAKPAFLRCTEVQNDGCCPTYDCGE